MYAQKSPLHVCFLVWRLRHPTIYRSGATILRVPIECQRAVKPCVAVTGKKHAISSSSVCLEMVAYCENIILYHSFFGRFCFIWRWVEMRHVCVSVPVFQETWPVFLFPKGSCLSMCRGTLIALVPSSCMLCRESCIKEVQNILNLMLCVVLRKEVYGFFRYLI